MDGLTGLRRPEDVAKLRGLSVKQVLGLDLQEAKAKAEAAAEASDEQPATGDQPEQPVAVATETPETTESTGETAPEQPSDG